MKIRFTILLLCVSLALKAQQLTSLEYYFDTDPGFGNGVQLALNNTASLDSIFNFPVNSLSQGVHTIFIRLKNSDNNWSFPIYEGNFLLWTGTSGTSQIQMLNYFVDSTANLSSIPLNLSASLDTTISIPIPDNNANTRVLGLRLKNQSGQLGNATLTTISLCDLYKPFGKFIESQYGNTISFLDNSSYNPSGKIAWTINNSVADSGRLFSFNFSPNFGGNLTIGQITGIGCRKDTLNELHSFAGLERFDPNRFVIGNDGELNLYGGGMDTNMVVYLQRNGVNVYPFAKSAFSQGRQMSCYFDFHAVGPILPFGSSAQFDLHVMFMNGHEEVRPQAITLRSPTDCDFNVGLRPIGCGPVADDEPYITADLTGDRNIRTGFWAKMNLEVTNRSYAVARQVPVWIMLPSYYEVKIGLPLYTPIQHSIDSLGLLDYSPVDTIINGRHFLLKLYGILVPVLAGGDSKNIPFEIRKTNPGTDSIFTWVRKRMFGSPMKLFWSNCSEEVFNFFIGFVPGAGCLNSVWDFSYGLVNGDTYTNANDQKSGGTFLWNTANTALSCIPAGTIATGLFNSKVINATGAAAENINVLQQAIVNTQNGAINSNFFLDCDPTKIGNPHVDPITGKIAYDPNKISGNSQHDTSRNFIDNFAPQHYTVSFENSPTATANAQHVWVTDTLNINKLVSRTFKISGFSIGDSTYVLPGYRNTMVRDVKLKSRNDMNVRFMASYDSASGIFRSDFLSIDTTGKIWDEASTDGFLPPDVDGITGTGSVLYEIFAKDMNTLDTFSNRASIYFDTNPPIATNTWINTVDTTSPASHIINSIRVNDTTTKLVMQHSDIGAGFKTANFFVKDNTDSLFRDKGTSAADTILFTGQLNHSYQIFSRAIDKVGNEEHKDSVADITIIFSNPLPLSWLSFTGKLINDRVQLQWTTANELKTSYFEVQHSTDGNTYNKIAIVTAKGGSQNNDYLTWDDHPANGNNYYRLKQFDIDGHFTYSSIVRIYYGKNGYVIIAPNPASDYVSIRGNQQFTAIELIDAAGKTVKLFQPSVNNIYSLSGVSKGLYYIRLINSSETQTYKLQIE